MNDVNSVDGQQNTELSRHGCRRGRLSRRGFPLPIPLPIWSKASSNSRQRARIQEKKKERAGRMAFHAPRNQARFLGKKETPLSQIKNDNQKEGREVKERDGRGGAERRRGGEMRERYFGLYLACQEKRPSLPISPSTNRNRHRAPPAWSDPTPNTSLPTMAGDTTRCHCLMPGNQGV
jgi:hypothetical protein